MANDRTYYRLIGYTLRIDTYIAVLRGQPAYALCEEINIPIQGPFTGYNAYGLDVYFRRSQTFPEDRNGYQIAELCDSSPRTLDSGFLIEDIQLGFCGIWPQIWKFLHNKTSYSNLTDDMSTCQELLWRRLNFWRSHLDRLTAVITDPNSNPPLLEALLRQYAGKEEPAHPDYQEVVTQRVSYRLFDACMLHRLLCLYIPVKILDTTTGSHPTMSMGTSDMRESFFQALSTLKAYEAFASSPRTAPGTISGIAHVALTYATEVAWGLLTSPARPCQCLDSFGRPIISQHSQLGGPPLSLATIADEELHAVIDSWVRTGEATFLDGEALCACNADAWIGRYLQALDAGTKYWDAGPEYAAGLRSRIENVLKASASYDGSMS